MIITITPSVEGRCITGYKGIVVGAANVVRDIFVSGPAVVPV